LYEKLPDVFLVFDLYDLHEQRFVSWARLCEIVAPTSLRLVPFIGHQTLTSRAELLALLDTHSQIGAQTTFVEGVVLRIEDGAALCERAKIVRPDFVQNIDEHWTKQGLVKNTVLF
jgi:hypothetical protein